VSDISERIDKLSPVKRALFELQETRASLSEMKRAREEPIAIVGMACRFPGGVDNPDAYWELLRNGVDAVTEVPPDRWDLGEYYDADPNAPGKMYTRHGGFLTQIDRFDSHFFGIAPREAMSMDPQQRVLLEVSWEALERAGLAPDRLGGTPTSVFVGISTSDYAYLGVRARSPRVIDA
jgi:acyl transferase domain-containing protein